MGKIEKQDQAKQNKGHKTLRDKLRKKREELKLHKKQKSQQKKAYDVNSHKQKYFSQNDKKQTKLKGIKVRKVKKHIEKFINIYEDDLEDFFSLFKTFDQNGFIDISDLENKQFQKCLKKLFKYLPLQKQKKQYSKTQNSSMNLEIFIRNMVSAAMEDYLENGTQKSESEGSSDEQGIEAHPFQTKSKTKKSEHLKEEENIEPITLYKQSLVQPAAVGPSIPEEYRDKIAEMFEQQLEIIKKEKQLKKEEENDQFSRIFSMSKTRKQEKEIEKPKSSIEDVPQHLLAKGSAKIGQKVQISQEELDEYDRVFRPKRLIDEHREMMQLSKPVEANGKKSRKPFDRERDIVYGQTPGLTNSTFYDFKGKMTKPKSTNSFL